MQLLARFIASFSIVAAVAGTMPAAAETPGPVGSIGVAVQGQGPVPAGTRVSVTKLGETQPRSADVGANGRAEIDSLAPGIYALTVQSTDRAGTTYVRVEPDKRAGAPIDLRGLPSGASLAATPDALLEAVRRAAEACDRAAYDRAVDELARVESLTSINLRDLNRLVDEYGNLSGYQPNLGQLRSIRDAMLRGVMGRGRTPTGQATRGGAPVDQGLIYLVPYISAIEERDKTQQRLDAIHAAQQRIPPFPTSCPKEVGQAGALELGAFAAYVRRDRPGSGYGSLEFGLSIERKNLLKFDNDEDGYKSGFSVGYSLPNPVFGLGGVKAEFTASYTRVGGSARGAPVAAGLGESLNLPSPGGGFTFAAGTFEDIRYKANQTAYDFSLKLEKSYGYGGLSVSPFVGLEGGWSKSDDKLNLAVYGAFDWSESRQLSTGYGGVTVGLEIEAPVGESGFHAFGYVGFDARMSRASADWRTRLDTGLLFVDQRSLSDTQATFGGTAWVGLAYEGRGFEAKTWIGGEISNHYPRLNVDSGIGDGNPKIDWKITTGWNIGASLAMKF